MSRYTFSEEAFASDFKIVFERFLFNEERHRLSQSKDNWKTFSLIDEQSKRVVAQVHFCVIGTIASSPLRAPFGSVEFSDTLSPENIQSFYLNTERRLKNIGVRKIRIKDAASQYKPQQSTLLNVVLLNSGFRISNSEINSAIEIDHVNFQNKISYAEAKRLKRCQQERLIFRPLSMDMLENIQSFIQSCREERGMSLSMTLPELKKTIQFCEDDFLLFGVFQNEELIAASISVRVNNRILYDFYHAHSKSADQLSPVVALVDGIYSYCGQNKFELLDLGTSTVDRQINFSLLNFKTRLGGLISMKLTFEKDLI